MSTIQHYCDQKKSPNVYLSWPNIIWLENDRFWHLYKNCLRMSEIWASQSLPKALKSYPESNKSTNLVTLSMINISTSRTDFSCPIIAFKNAPIPTSFCSSLSFSHHNSNIIRLKQRSCGWESNPVLQVGRRRLILWAMTAPTSGQSYKHFTLVNYDSRVVPDLKLPHITTL